MAACRAGAVTKARESLCATLGWPLSLVPDFLFQLVGNPLHDVAGLKHNHSFASALECARRVNEILDATTHIGFIRERATEICIGLQDLGLPALVTLQIIDEAVHENSIRMWAKWELITAVKHFHDRRANAE
jgi:hypothetical protein